MTKETGDSILITQATAEAMRTRPCRTMSRGDIELRGKTATVCVHALVPTEF
jgi:class 3 adenylate cyclase